MKNIEKSYSIILPTYNEEGHIKKLIHEIYDIFSKNDILFEIIIVDDNSSDGTINIINEICSKNKNIEKIIRYNKKSSLVDSLNEGIFYSNYENIIWMDADYSHPPKFLNHFFEQKDQEFDVIVFSRFLKDSRRYFDKEGLSPKFIDKLSFILNQFCKFLLYKNFTDYTSGFICIKKSIINNYNLTGHYGDYFIRLINYCFLKQARIKELPFTELDRLTGYSKTTSNKLNFFVKCYFYLYTIIECYLKKVFKITE